MERLPIQGGFRVKRWVALVLLVPLFIAAGEKEHGPIDYGGWEKCFQFRAQDKDVTALLVPQIGARLIQYSLNGENILFDPVEARGKTIEKNTGWFWAGGYQIDIGPEMRGIPAHRELWMGGKLWGNMRSIGRGPLIIESEPEPILGVKITKSIYMNRTTGTLDVGQEMTNVSEKVQNYCFWDRTLCEGGGYSIIKLNPKSRYKAGWCWGTSDKNLPGGWSYNGDTPESPNVKILDGVLVAHCFGKSGSKLGTDSHAGWIAYARGKLLFIKQFPVDPNGKYTDGGMTVANYYSDRVAELEPISPEVAMKPNESYSFDERWFLVALDEAVDSHEKARALVGKVEETIKEPKKYE